MVNFSFTNGDSFKRKRTGEQIFRGECGPLMSGTSHVPPPDEYRADESGFPNAMASARYIEYILEKEGDISAVIAEPVRWTPYVPPPDYWKVYKNDDFCI